MCKPATGLNPGIAMQAGQGLTALYLCLACTLHSCSHENSPAAAIVHAPDYLSPSSALMLTVLCISGLKHPHAQPESPS